MTTQDQRMRESRRPDWISVFLGVTCTFAMMGVLSIFGSAMRLWEFKLSDSVAILVIKLLWLISSVAGSMFIGGFITGTMLEYRGKLAAAMDGILVWEFTIITFSAVAWFGYSPLPGFIIRETSVTSASQGFVWMAMLLGLPLPFVTAYGAMAGNEYVHKRETPGVPHPIGGPIHGPKIAPSEGTRKAG